MAGLENLGALYGLLDRVIVNAGSDGAAAPPCLDPAVKDIQPGWSGPQPVAASSLQSTDQFDFTVPTDGSDPIVAARVGPHILGGGGFTIGGGDSAESGNDEYVQSFINVRAACDAFGVPSPPSVVEALTDIAQAIGDGQELTTPDRARYFSALVGIAQMLPAARVATSRPQVDLSTSEPFLDVLAAIGPRDVPLTERRTRAADVAPDLLALTTRASANDGNNMLTAYAVHRHLLPSAVQYIGTCTTDVIQVDGVDCAVIDTYCGARDVSLEALMSIVNPFNWALNYNQFFKAVEPVRPWGVDGWTRMRETVSLLGIAGVSEVTTHLRFHTSSDGPGVPGWCGQRPASARIDYDLDEKDYDDDLVDAPYNRANDPIARAYGPVNVDRGWINMWTNNDTNDPTAPGVRVRTRKVVQLDTVNPNFQRIALGPLGYGKASAEFLLGPAKTRPVRYEFLYRGWPPSPTGPPPPPPPPPNSSPPPPGSQPTTAAPSATAPATQPVENPPHFARAAVKIWTDTAKQMTTDYANVAGRWTTGRLTPAELAEYATTTTGRLISAPFAFLDQMLQTRTPPTQPGGES
jgi:hypothetical protein